MNPCKRTRYRGPIITEKSESAIKKVIKILNSKPRTGESYPYDRTSGEILKMFITNDPLFKYGVSGSMVETWDMSLELAKKSTKDRREKGLPVFDLDCDISSLLSDICFERFVFEDSLNDSHDEVSALEDSGIVRRILKDKVISEDIGIIEALRLLSMF